MVDKQKVEAEFADLQAQIIELTARNEASHRELTAVHSQLQVSPGCEQLIDMLHSVSKAI